MVNQDKISEVGCTKRLWQSCGAEQQSILSGTAGNPEPMRVVKVPVNQHLEVTLNSEFITACKKVGETEALGLTA